MPSRCRTIALLGGLAALTVADAARADEPRPFCADRPGLGTPPCVLDVGRLQVEVGLADIQRDRQDGVTNHTDTFGDLELRLGMTPTTEVQLGWAAWSRGSDAASLKRGGFGDLTLGLRRSLAHPDGDGVSVAVQPFVTAPTATGGRGAGGWSGGLVAPVSLPLTEAVSLALTPEVDVTRDADGHGAHLTWSQVIGLSRGLGPVSAGVELWVSRDQDPAGGVTQAAAAISAAWTPSKVPDLQFDAGLTAGLNHATPDLDVYVGVARRF